MTSYDSDSSDGGNYTETNVLLGYASKEAADDTISKLGGYPDWLEAGKPPSAALVRCKVCKELMVLLLQLNAELPDKFPGHDRRIFVFACRRASCMRKDGSIRALRGVRVWEELVKEHQNKEAEKAKAKPQKEDGPALGDALFGGKGLGGAGAANPFSANNANPFKASSSSNPFSSPSSNPFSSPLQSSSLPKAKEQPPSSLTKTFAETLSLNSPPSQPPPPPEPWPEQSAHPKPYPALYLAEADYETLEPDDNKTPENVRIESADAPEPSALDREAFESTMDATFQKFADRLAQNPDQAIRYEFSGQPLLYSKKDAVGQKLSKGGMPGCSNCGGRRTFEVQLTPNAIAEMEAEELSLEGMEWGTVIVGVCEEDCIPRGTGLDEVGYIEEWAGVQWEELTKRK